MDFTRLTSLVPLEGKTLSDASYINAGAGDATVVKATPGALYGVEAFNNSSTIAYLKFYDKTTTPLDSDTPKRTMLIPNNAGAGAGFVRSNPHGMIFTSGISFRIVTGIAVGSSAAAGANTVIVNMEYS